MDWPSMGEFSNLVKLTKLTLEYNQLFLSFFKFLLEDNQLFLSFFKFLLEFNQTVLTIFQETLLTHDHRSYISSD